MQQNTKMTKHKCNKIQIFASETVQRRYNRKPQFSEADRHTKCTTICILSHLCCILSYCVLSLLCSVFLCFVIFVNCRFAFCHICNLSSCILSYLHFVVLHFVIFVFCLFVFCHFFILSFCILSFPELCFDRIVKRRGTTKHKEKTVFDFDIGNCV